MTLDLPGFADPAAQSQACFRAILDAMSRPGTVLPAGTDLRPPATLAPATAAALLTLVDGDTPLWLDPAMAPARDWVAFHCGAAAAPIGDAIFACAAAMPPLAALDAGTDLAPESSATLLLQLDTLGEGQPYRLSGPGIQAETLLHAAGLPPGFAAQWAANGAIYPRGIDLILCAGTQLCALPRTTRVQAA